MLLSRSIDIGCSIKKQGFFLTSTFQFSYKGSKEFLCKTFPRGKEVNESGVAAPLTTGAPFRGRSDGGRSNLLPPNLLLPLSLSVRSPLLRVSVVNQASPPWSFYIHAYFAIQFENFIFQFYFLMFLIVCFVYYSIA